MDVLHFLISNNLLLFFVSNYELCRIIAMAMVENLVLVSFICLKELNDGNWGSKSLFDQKTKTKKKREKRRMRTFL